MDGGLILFLEGIPDHLSADESQHAKGHPVVVGLDFFLKETGEEPADERHKRLEQAKEEGQPQHDAQPRFPAKDDGAYHGHRKAVHGKSQCYEEVLQHYFFLTINT